MAMTITQRCLGCYACEQVCPNQAIEILAGIFTIIAELCQECIDDFSVPQCSAICPAEEAILDRHGYAVNPLGSLTGVPAEIRSRWMV
ncbi:MAG: 4Fe-4S binding protein [Magnetococcales bacterium]|nr:4Fe-4S binding protein [Magnetococcales bacterium]